MPSASTSWNSPSRTTRPSSTAQGRTTLIRSDGSTNPSAPDLQHHHRRGDSTAGIGLGHRRPLQVGDHQPNRGPLQPPLGGHRLREEAGHLQAAEERGAEGQGPLRLPPRRPTTTQGTRPGRTGGPYLPQARPKPTRPSTMVSPTPLEARQGRRLQAVRLSPPHLIRASAATALSEAGVPTRSIMLQGGWDTERSLRHYLRDDLEAHRERLREVLDL